MLKRKSPGKDGMGKALHGGIAFIAALALLNCKVLSGKRWEYDSEKKGLHFKKLRYSVGRNGDTTTIIGYLKDNTVINGLPCKKGWIHFSKNWKLKLFCLYEPAVCENIPLPENSWILKRADTEFTTVVFPKDTVIQGFPVKGGGGAKGVHTRFYRSGKLKSFFPSKDFIFDETGYKKSVFKSIQLDENGIIKKVNE
jgi:hypothetical protein